MQKKVEGISISKKILLALIIFQTLLLFASAETTAQEAGTAVNIFGQGFLDFLKAVIGAEGTAGLELIPYLAMGAILLLFTFSAYDAMGFFGKGKEILNWVLAAATTLIVLIALPPQLYKAILPSYGAFGAAVLTVVPFLMVFFFSIRVRSVAFAKIVWGLFAAYYLVFYGLVAYATGQAGAYGNTAVYIIIGIAGGFMFWQIPYFRHLFNKAEIDEVKDDIKSAGKVTEALFEARAEEVKGNKVLADVAKE